VIVEDEGDSGPDCVNGWGGLGGVGIQKGGCADQRNSLQNRRNQVPVSQESHEKGPGGRGGKKGN